MRYKRKKNKLSFWCSNVSPIKKNSTEFRFAPFPSRFKSCLDVNFFDWKRSIMLKNITEMKRSSLNCQGFPVFKRHLSRLTPSNEILFALLRLYTRTTSIDRETEYQWYTLGTWFCTKEFRISPSKERLDWCRIPNWKLNTTTNQKRDKHNKQPMGTQAHCPKRGKMRVTESVREVTHVVYFSLSLAPTDAFPPFFPMRKTDYFSFSALKNSTTRPALTPLCLRCIILCLECMFYSRFYFKSWALSFSFLLFSYEILVSFIRLSWKKVL